MSAIVYPPDMPTLIARSLEASANATRRAVAKAFGLANGWLLAPHDDTGFSRAVRAHNADWRDDMDETFPGCRAVFYGDKSGRICAAVILSSERPHDDGLLLEELPDAWLTGLRTFVVRRA